MLMMIMILLLLLLIIIIQTLIIIIITIQLLIHIILLTIMIVIMKPIIIISILILILILIIIMTIVITITTTGVPGEKNSSGEEDIWEDELAEHGIRGWRAVSATGMQGKGLCKNSVFHKHRYVYNFSGIGVRLVCKLFITILVPTVVVKSPCKCMQLLFTHACA